MDGVNNTFLLNPHASTVPGSPHKSPSPRHQSSTPPISDGTIPPHCVSGRAKTSEAVHEPAARPTLPARREGITAPLIGVKPSRWSLTRLPTLSAARRGLGRLHLARPASLGLVDGTRIDEEVLNHARVREDLETILQLHENIRDLRLRIALEECGHNDELYPTNSTSILDLSKVNHMTSLATRANTSLPDVVQIQRGETEVDPRPNKALRPNDYRRLLGGYEHQDFMAQAATYGIRPTWLRGRPHQQDRPSNHHSAVRFAAAVARSVHQGQDADQYLVVDGTVLDSWPEVQISPLGAVEKAGVDPKEEVRLIHDLKRPLGSSTNEATDRSVLPQLTYKPVSDLARRIDTLYARDPAKPRRMMQGDVKGAFRHLMVAAASVSWMGARLDNNRYTLIDLSAPFGWTSSPTYYGAFGGAITWLVRRKSPASMTITDSDTDPFSSYEWVDDHVLIEHDTGSRLQLAETALRHSMMAVCGPRALNEKKFSDWGSRLEVLGLEFDLDRRTISMPTRKIDKALARVDALLLKSRATRSDLQRLLGSLRHVCTCCRAVKPFYQRVHGLVSVAPVHGTVTLKDGVREDLRWSRDLLHLGRFRDLPTTMFAAWPAPDIHLYMDASCGEVPPFFQDCAVAPVRHMHDRVVCVQVAEESASRGRK